MPKKNRVTRNGQRIRRRKSAKAGIKRGGGSVDLLPKMVGGALSVTSTNIATTGIVSGNTIELEEGVNKGKVTFTFTNSNEVTLEFAAVTSTSTAATDTFYDEFITAVLKIYLSPSPSSGSPSVTNSVAGGNSIILEKDKITSTSITLPIPNIGLTENSTVTGSDVITRIQNALNAFNTAIPKYTPASSGVGVSAAAAGPNEMEQAAFEAALAGLNKSSLESDTASDPVTIKTVTTFTIPKVTAGGKYNLNDFKVTFAKP